MSIIIKTEHKTIITIKTFIKTKANINILLRALKILHIQEEPLNIAIKILTLTKTILIFIIIEIFVRIKIHVIKIISLKTNPAIII